MSQGTFMKCTPRQARKFIIECIQAGLVPFLQSSPGMGKSEIIASISTDFELEMIDHRLSTSEPTDMTGLPDLQTNKGFAQFVPFTDLFPIQGMTVPEGKNGWMLFLDEFNSADRKVQAAAYKLILDKKVGQKKLHECVAMVAAGNLITDRAIVNPISTAMQSRVIHIEMDINFEEWLKDVALKRFFDGRIIAYLSQFESKLMDFKPDHHEKTFCCPRTWEFVNKLISTPVTDKNGKLIRRDQKPIDDETTILLGGTITSGTATEFVQFTKVYNELISVHEIMQDPKKCRLPPDRQLMWATITHMMEKVDNQNFKKLAEYADRFDLSFRLLFYRSILVRKPELRTHPDFGPAVAGIIQYLNS